MLNQKKVLIIILLPLIFSIFSCKTALYQPTVAPGIITSVVLDGANYRYMGSFEGRETRRKSQGSIKDDNGIVSEAKKDMLKNAKKKGVELTGPRALVNVTIDILETSNRVTCIMSADIIEFKK